MGGRAAPPARENEMSDDRVIIGHNVLRHEHKWLNQTLFLVSELTLVVRMADEPSFENDLDLSASPPPSDQDVDVLAQELGRLPDSFFDNFHVSKSYY